MDYLLDLLDDTCIKQLMQDFKNELLLTEPPYEAESLSEDLIAHMAEYGVDVTNEPSTPQCTRINEEWQEFVESEAWGLGVSDVIDRIAAEAYSKEWVGDNAHNQWILDRISEFNVPGLFEVYTAMMPQFIKAYATE